MKGVSSKYCDLIRFLSKEISVLSDKEDGGFRKMLKIPERHMFLVIGKSIAKKEVKEERTINNHCLVNW